ncbi:MAG: thioredoxin family protein [Clostridia bacterium]|nr:thioredoxin family protein [Clostridia bacterium]
MGEILYFYLSSCPHCSKADRIIRSVVERYPEFKQVKIRKIEESLKPDIADKYDYYYVPCFFVNGKKIFEGPASVEKVYDAFREALKQTDSENN